MNSFEVKLFYLIADIDLTDPLYDLTALYNADQKYNTFGIK